MNRLPYRGDEEDSGWEAMRMQHPDLPMEYWAEGGDIFWESEWLFFPDAQLFLDSVSEFDNEEMPENYESLLKAFSAQLSMDDQHEDCRMKFLYFGDSGRLHVLCIDEDEGDEFEVNRKSWEALRDGSLKVGLSVEEDRAGLLKRIRRLFPSKTEIVSMICLAFIVTMFVAAAISLLGLGK